MHQAVLANGHLGGGLCAARSELDRHQPQAADLPAMRAACLLPSAGQGRQGAVFRVATAPRRMHRRH